MTYQNQTSRSDESSARLILPRLESIYAVLRPLSVFYMRLIAGVALAAHGLPKIQNPMGTVGMVESLGFYPGWFFAPALAVTEFVGGLFLAFGLLTRPVALAASFVLAVTVYYHWIVKAEGYAGSEISLIWLGVTLYFVAHGGGRYSLDHKVGRQF